MGVGLMGQGQDMGMAMMGAWPGLTRRDPTGLDMGQSIRENKFFKGTALWGSQNTMGHSRDGGTGGGGQGGRLPSPPPQIFEN